MPAAVTFASVPAARAALAVLLAATAAAGASACGSRREARAQTAERKEIRDLARRAAELATTDTGSSSQAERDSDSAAAKRSPVGRATISGRLAHPGDLVVAGAGGAGAGTAGAGTAGGAPGELRIVSTNGAVVYTLARDTVRMQLGDTVVRAMRRKAEANADSATSPFGSFIARTVAGAMGSAAGFVVKTPVRDIRSARYDDGELQIESGGGASHHATVGVGGKKGHDATVFTRADAERFVAAIEARQRALGVR